MSDDEEDCVCGRVEARRHEVTWRGLPVRIITWFDGINAKPDEGCRGDYIGTVMERNIVTQSRSQHEAVEDLLALLDAYMQLDDRHGGPLTPERTLHEYLHDGEKCSAHYHACWEHLGGDPIIDVPAFHGCPMPEGGT